jgi:hypothetical protein
VPLCPHALHERGAARRCAVHAAFLFHKADPSGFVRNLFGPPAGYSHEAGEFVARAGPGHFQEPGGRYDPVQGNRAGGGGSLVMVGRLHGGGLIVSHLNECRRLGDINLSTIVSDRHYPLFN